MHLSVHICGQLADFAFAPATHCVLASLREALYWLVAANFLADGTLCICLPSAGVILVAGDRFELSTSRCGEIYLPNTSFKITFAIFSANSLFPLTVQCPKSPENVSMK